MKRLLKIVFILLVLIIIAAVAAPFVIPPETVKQAVLAQIIKATGRKVSIGKVSVSLFPDIGFTASNVVVPQPDWATGEDMMHIASMHLGVELMPLLQMHPQVRVKDLTLNDSVIRLVKRGARANWQFSDPTQAQPRAAGAAQNAANNAKGVSADAFSLDKITIKNGSITYDDGSPAPKTVSALNVTLEAPNPNEKVIVDGSATYNGQTASLTLTLERPLLLTSGKPSPVDLKLKTSNLNLYWQGALALVGNVPSLTGTVDIPELTTANFNAAPAAAAPDEAQLAPITPSAPAAADTGRWSDAPFHIEALASFNANLKVTIDKLNLPKTSLPDVNLQVLVQYGGISVTAPKINAYDGTLSASVSIASNYVARFSASISDVKAQPLLHDFAAYDKLSGTLAGRLNVAAQGKSERQLVASLGGTGDFHCKDGKLIGVNLVSLIRNIAVGAQNSPAQSTDFSDLSGSYTIKSGVVTNNNLKLVSPLLHVSGAGTIDLPQWQVHYLLKPEIVGAAQAQPSATGGIIVPVNVDGPLDNPRFKADIQDAITDNLKDPAALKNNLKAIKQNLLQGGSNGASNVKNSLKGLLNGF